MQAEGLCHIPAAFFVGGECNGVGQQRFRGPKVSFQSIGDFELFDRVGCLI
jgi:hypothetical protein